MDSETDHEDARDTNGRAAALVEHAHRASGETRRSDVDEILRRKRKAREYKACYPCRQRKVKCDQAVPCKTCVAREHPELCTYHPPSENHPPAKRLSAHHGNGIVGAPASGSDTVTLTRESWDRMCSKLSAAEKAISDLKGAMRTTSEGPALPIRSSLSPGEYQFTPSTSSTLDEKARHYVAEGIHTRNEFSGEMVHIGGASVPALVLALGRGEEGHDEVQELLGKSILPIFGLDNESATYPFVDLWSLPHGSITKITEVVKTLPSDSQILDFFKYYKDVAYVVFPGIAYIEKFEQDLAEFLANRASMQSNKDGSNGITEQSVYGKTIGWIGLLFAALASGCAMSTVKRKERDLTSQVFVCCAFECLRISNFLSRATLDTIQTLLIIGNVIQNGMNAGVAWSLLGLTIRLGETLGLHRVCPAQTSYEIRIKRSRIWWAVIWHDTLLSITYDRVSSTASLERPPHFPMDSTSGPGTRNYHECMYRLCRVTLEVMRDRSTTLDQAETLAKIAEHRRGIQQVMDEAADYFKDIRKCKSSGEQLQYWALFLNVSYVTAETCRSALSPAMTDSEATREIRKLCIDSLANVVEAFLGLHNETPFAIRSWAAMHRALSSSILLGILGEPARNERARTLLIKLIDLLTNITSAFHSQELSMPIKRSIAALKMLTQAATGERHPAPAAAPVREPESISQLSSAAADRIFGNESLNGVSFNPDDSPLMGMSPFLNNNVEESPYVLMDSIMWGVQKPTMEGIIRR